MQKAAQEARQTALKHTHKLPRKLWDDKNEVRKINQSVKMQLQGAEACGSTCKERKKLWRKELTSLTTLVGAVATLLAVITPSEGAETEGGTGGCLKWEHESGLDGLMNLDYWMVLPLILMITTGLIVRIKRYLEERQKPGDEGPILWRCGSSRRRGRLCGQQLSQDQQWEKYRSGSATPAVQRGSVPRRMFFATQQRIAITWKLK